MVAIEIRYVGGLRCEAVHGPSGTALETDAPADNHGKGERFSPTDLVATALGACMATVMGIVAEREGLSLEGMAVSVEKEMVAEPVRRIGRLRVRIAMPAGLAATQRKKLELAAHTCPVKQSLSPEVRVDLTFTYPEEVLI